MQDPVRSSLAQRVLRVAQRLFVPLALIFLAAFAWQGRDTLLNVLASGKPWRLLLSALLWSCMPLLAPLFSLIVFRALGQPFSYLQLAAIHIGNLPARYIPGGIWHTVGRIAALSKLGASKRDITTVVLLENALAVGIAFAIGGPLVALYRGLAGWGLLAALAGISGLLGVAVLPWLLNHRLASGPRGFSGRAYLACAGSVAAAWCIGAAAFVIFLTAFSDLQLRASALEAGATYLFAWGMGFIAIFAPQGIGVFEAVAGDLLSPPGAFKSIAALMLGFRLVILLSDALVWLAYQAMGAGSRRAGEGNHLSKGRSDG